MHRYTAASCSLAVLAITVALIAGAVTGPVAAQSDDTSVLDVITGDADSAFEAAQNSAKFVAGWVDGKIEKLAADETEHSAAGVAATLREDINGNATAYQQWLNDRLQASTDRAVLQVTVENETDSARFYVVTDVSNGSYENLRATTNTSKTVGESCMLSGRAAANAPDELDTFRTEYVDANRSVDTSHTGRLAAEYDDEISCTFTEG